MPASHYPTSTARGSTTQLASQCSNLCRLFGITPAGGAFLCDVQHSAFVLPGTWLVAGVEPDGGGPHLISLRIVWGRLAFPPVCKPKAIPSFACGRAQRFIELSGDGDRWQTGTSRRTSYAFVPSPHPLPGFSDSVPSVRRRGGVLSRYTFGPFYVCRNWAVKKRGSYNAKVLIRGAATHRRRNSADRKCK
jgi:hypothetical protein